MKKDLFQTLKILLAAVVLSLGISYVYAWTSPTVAPPNGNTPAPINVGGTSQAKAGNLTIGSATPSTQTLSVVGNVVVGGTANFLSSVVIANTLTNTGTAGQSCGSVKPGTFKFDGTNFLGCTGGNNKWVALTSATPTAPTPTPTPTAPKDINLTIAANTSDYVISKQPAVASAISANPNSSVSIILTINSGVTVKGSPAIKTGTIPAGSSIHIINKGEVVGTGGTGGTGSAGATSAQKNGVNGGDAIDISGTVTLVDNYGKIYGGGGGGGAGDSIFCPVYAGQFAYVVNGGGGGGGAGTPSGVGGFSIGGGVSWVANGTRGGNASGSVGGTGGTGAIAWNFYRAGSGGAGGSYGSDGGAGSTGNIASFGCNNGAGTHYSAGSGGQGGYAVRTNGTTLNWGVKGSVIGKY